MFAEQQLSLLVTLVLVLANGVIWRNYREILRINAYGSRYIHVTVRFIYFFDAK